MPLAIGDALTDRDVHIAWRIRSTAAESALASAFGLAGGPVPSQGLVLGRGIARLRVDAVGGRRVNRFRPDLYDLANVTEVHMFRSYTIAPFTRPQKETTHSSG